MIAAISGAISSVLTDALDPAVSVVGIRGEELASGALTPPALAVLLYGIAVNPARRVPGPVGPAAQGPPPFDLRYLVTAFGTDAPQEHDLLGTAMRTLQDIPLLQLPDGSEVQVVIEDLPTEGLAQLFGGLGCRLRPAVPLLARSAH